MEEWSSEEAEQLATSDKERIDTDRREREAKAEE
jgi:hypothetical protein